VDPKRLRAAADAQSEVADYVSGMSVGQLISGGVSAMSGLDSAAACAHAGSILDAAAQRVSAELAAHSKNLLSAADRYGTVDENLGRRLRSIAD
jgi:hypothetical protein